MAEDLKTVFTRIIQRNTWMEPKTKKKALEKLKNFKKVISINFTAEDLLLVSSISLLRAGDYNIDNNNLEVDTVKKLNNRHYRDTLALIYQSYPFLDTSEPSIPRYVLREFYKFGFKNTDVNGYWIKQKQMQYYNSEVCYFSFSCFHNYDKFVILMLNHTITNWRLSLISKVLFYWFQDAAKFVIFKPICVRNRFSNYV